MLMEFFAGRRVTMEMSQAEAIDVNQSVTERANDGLQMMKCSLGRCRDVN